MPAPEEFAAHFNRATELFADKRNGAIDQKTFDREFQSELKEMERIRAIVDIHHQARRLTEKIARLYSRNSKTGSKSALTHLECDRTTEAADSGIVSSNWKM